MLPILCTILSAVLFYLSFPNCISIVGYWPCIWVFAVPLLIALHEKPLRQRLGFGILFGVLAYGLMTQGLFLISPAGYLGFVLALSIQAVIFAVLCRYTGKHILDVLYFPCIWAISELFRNFLLGGFSFNISHAHAFCPLMLKLYGILGCLGMSFIIFLVNDLIYLAFINKQNRLNFIIAAGIFFWGVVMAGFCIQNVSLLQGHPLRVAIIQGNISPSQKASIELFDRNANIHMRLTQQAYIKARPDLVIWPETAFPDDLLQNTQWRSLIAAQAARMNADLLVGMAPIIDGKEYNSALLFNHQGLITGLYNKQSLVPFAETTPFESWGINWGRGYHFKPGDKPGILALSHESLLFGVVICSESAHPLMVRNLKKRGANFLVEMSNDAWFTDKASYMLHAQAAVMRALENRMWVIRAANTGISFAVDPNGMIHTDRNLKLGHEGYGIFDIMIN